MSQRMGEHHSESLLGSRGVHTHTVCPVDSLVARMVGKTHPASTCGHVSPAHAFTPIPTCRPPLERVLHVLAGLEALVAVACAPDAAAQLHVTDTCNLPGHVSASFRAASLWDDTPTRVAEQHVTKCVASLPSLF